jgi:mRNA interferase RelE/StbE
MLERIRSVIRELTENPRPDGVKKLIGYKNLYRIRVGDWRIIYAIEDGSLIVVILEISPRGNAYRDR